MDEDSISLLEKIHGILLSKAPEAIPLLEQLISKFPTFSNKIVEAEKRPRSLVIIGVPEPDATLAPSARQLHTEKSVTNILDALDVEARPMYTTVTADFSTEVVSPMKPHEHTIKHN
ncbi:hypothetical protein OESDEN_00228 [Oesophagostomum dentatum]|uniref:Uncharacterized protein n=1 Tax=Oesophagostomum dentatum TaxID=61180 RepID=A0A0B1TQG2_OESDE|nr:hypothetical protein OESDEN_00228 [Oesophagostomum dentatum]